MTRTIIAALALAGAATCGWPETRMVPSGDAQATASRPVVTAAPAFTAGPDSLRTTARDGSSNVFVCSNGDIVPARQVPANSTLVC